MRKPKRNDDTLFMPINEVAQKLDITRATELKWRKTGILPEPLKFGRTVLYRRHEIMKLAETP